MSRCKASEILRSETYVAVSLPRRRPGKDEGTPQMSVFQQP